jgi:glycine betaine/proline transport system substrate-binding protein
MGCSAKAGSLWIGALLGMVFLSAFAPKEKAPGSRFSASSKGKAILLARADWDTSWFEAEIFRQLLQRLGYQVAEAKTMNDTQFFDAVSHNEVNFWPSGWFPNTDQLLAKVKDQVQAVGYVVKAGALQGYLIDRKTSERYGIKNLQSLQKPEIARLFDIDGDGKADLVGCNLIGRVEI